MEFVPTGRPGEVLPNAASGGRSLSWWGMILLIATEATLFGLLIASYWYLRFRNETVWPPDGIEPPELGLALIMTAILWTSSIPMHLADRGIRKGSQTRLRAGLLVAFLMGLTFFVLQSAVEYPEKLEVHPPASGIYGTLFFGLTGLHGLHLLVGLLMSLWVQTRAWRGAFTQHRHVSVQNLAWYWHFVDVVWLFVLATVYLAPAIE